MMCSRYFISAAEAGNAGAYAFLGKMYLDGTQATPQDNPRAFEFFMKSADKVSQRVLFILLYLPIILYLFGDDSDILFQNNAMGQSGLGIMYLQGRGVKKVFAVVF